MPPSLVVQTSFLGDTVLTTPLIRAAAAHGPVDVVTTPSGAAILTNNPHVRRLLVYDKRGQQRGMRGLRAAAQAARAESKVAVAYLAQGSIRSAALALLAGYRTRVGFDTSAGRLLYTHRIRYRSDVHHAERLWRLCGGDAASSPTPDVLRPRLYPGAPERDAVDQLLATAGWNGERLVALAPGSVWATKRWPYYADLARRLTSEGRLVIIGSAADAPLAAEIVGATFGGAIDAAGRLSLLGSAELIRRCALLISNDSAPQHLASAMNTPTVTIFGPTVSGFGFGPLAEGSVTVGHQALACRPCHPHGPPICPLGHWKCMRELTIENVTEAMRRATPTQGTR